MSRTNHSTKRGVSPRRSDKKFKTKGNRKLRRKNKVKVPTDPDLYATKKEMSSLWDSKID